MNRKLAYAMLLIFAAYPGCNMGDGEDNDELLSPEDEAELHDAYFDQITEDEKALAGGRAESGYSPAGFLVSKGEDGGVGYCTATLIGKDVIVTAAHCVAHTYLLEKPSNVIFSLGKDVKHPKITRSAKRIKVHPKYPMDINPTSVQGYDVAIVYLSKKITGVKYAKLSKKPLIFLRDQDGNTANSDKSDKSGKSSSESTAACKYRSLGYGVGLDKEKFNGRRSVQACATTRLGDEEQFVSFQPVGGVNCGGDSGGPIFREKTVEIAAIANGSFCEYERPTTIAFSIDTDPSFFGKLLD